MISVYDGKTHMFTCTIIIIIPGCRSLKSGLQHKEGTNPLVFGQKVQ